MKLSYISLQYILILLVMAFIAGTYAIEHHHRQLTLNLYLESAKLTNQLFSNALHQYATDTTSQQLLESDKKNLSLIGGHKSANPGKFAIDLINSVSSEDQKIKIYSQHHFPSRKYAAKPKKEVEKRILRYFSYSQDEDFYESSGDIFFYAAPIKMTSQVCVDCHNKHPQSPKKNWALNDTRAIFTITHKIEFERHYVFYGVFFGLFFLCIGLVIFLLRKTKQLNDKTQEIKIDNLTQIPNRAFINEDGKKLFIKRSRNNANKGVSILMIDIDNFKSINDTYGHDIGDECLKEIAQRISMTVRTDGDVVKNPNYAARWGGEEFLAMLSNTNEEDAIAIADRMRVEVKKRKVSSAELEVTISIGVCFIHRAYKPDFKHAEKIADDALLMAKTSGKDCTILYHYKDKENNTN